MAEAAAIKRVCRELARKHYPDLGRAPGAHERMAVPEPAPGGNGRSRTGLPASAPPVCRDQRGAEAAGTGVTSSRMMPPVAALPLVVPAPLMRAMQSAR